MTNTPFEQLPKDQQRRLDAEQDIRDRYAYSPEKEAKAEEFYRLNKEAVDAFEKRTGGVVRADTPILTQEEALQKTNGNSTSAERLIDENRRIRMAEKRLRILGLSKRQALEDLTPHQRAQIANITRAVEGVLGMASVKERIAEIAKIGQDWEPRVYLAGSADEAEKKYWRDRAGFINPGCSWKRKLPTGND